MLGKAYLNNAIDRTVTRVVLKRTYKERKELLKIQNSNKSCIETVVIKMDNAKWNTQNSNKSCIETTSSFEDFEPIQTQNSNKSCIETYSERGYGKGI